MDGDYHRATRLLDLLCDADRLRLIGRLIDGNSTITELADELGMKPQAVARHVRSLEDAGLLRQGVGGEKLAFDVVALRERVAGLRPEMRKRSEANPTTMRGYSGHSSLTAGSCTCRPSAAAGRWS